MDQATTITGVFAGPVATPWPGRPPSAIHKRALAGPAALGPQGIEGDAQADRRVHGGPGKAVHVYPSIHYAAWAGELGARAAFAPGGFGENVSLDWDEEGTCIGDVLRLGTATVAVSQGRQPCWKWAAKAEVEDMVARVRASRRTGWYLRVIEAGALAAGDAATLIERPHPEWSVARVAGALFGRADAEVDRALAGLGALDGTWRTLFARRAARRAGA